MFSSLLPQSTPLGELTLTGVYDYYDKPILFSCKNTDGVIFLAILVFEEGPNSTWLYASMSEFREEQIYAGRIDLHDAFAKQEDGILHKVTRSHDQEKVELISTESINNVDLPKPGILL